MKNAKLFSILVLTAIVTYGAVGLSYLPLARFHGDLTRVSMLPETLFGWRKPQPDIPADLIRQATWEEADILVVGDSFSGSRVWQTKLVGQGWKVRTEHWNSVRNICEDFVPWVRGKGFKGKYVVLESIERGFPEIRKSLDCKSMEFHSSVEADRVKLPPLAVFDPDEIAFTGRMSIGIQTRRMADRYLQVSADPAFKSWTPNGAVNVVRTERGCELFSHRQCRDVLFMREDRPQDVDESLIDVMIQLNQRLPGLTPIWVVVPNKSTSYLYPEKHFWSLAATRLATPDVLARLRQAITAGTVDLYPANESHLSTTGYLILGDLIYKQLLDQGMPPRPTGRTE